jgi:hypothetical protein
MLAEWSNCLEKVGQFDVIYTDFQKAFDIVPRRQLPSNLKGYGDENKLMDWIKKFWLCTVANITGNGHLKRK